MAANPQAIAVITYETMRAGPAPVWPSEPAAAEPVDEKIPAPMIAPIPSAVSCHFPRERASACSPCSASDVAPATLFRRISLASMVVLGQNGITHGGDARTAPGGIQRDDA